MNPRRRLTISYFRRSYSFVASLVLRDIKLRYVHSFLGVAWLALEPLVFAFTLSIVFSLNSNLKAATPGYPYPLFFYSGILVWRFFAKAITDGTGTFRAERMLIGKYNFPREILVGKNVALYWIEFAFASLSLFAMLAFFSHAPATSWVMLLPWFVLTTAICSGLILNLASLNVFVSDVGTFFSAMTSVIFWLSPIIFRIKMESDSYWLLWLNPVAAPIEIFRMIVLDRMFPPAILFGAATIWAVGLNLIGYTLFKKLEGGFVDAL